MMETAAINLKAKLSQFNELWTPYIIAQLNEYHIKVVKIQGEFVWHSHPETDEAFFVLSGSMRILLPDGEVALNEGELFVVPRGLEHKPVALLECAVLLIEPAGTLNTGDSGGERTKSSDSWI
jgi:mannose-6-phosphate isomerase-like protein (cupin superfamily)